MAELAPLPPFAAIVVAAGKGLRAGQAVPKQFADWQGKPLVRHSVERLLEAGARPVIVAVPAGHEAPAQEALAGLDVRMVSGDATRQGSVANALDALSAHSPIKVLIHDAARPDLPLSVIERLLTALETSPGAIPVLPVVDSIAIASDGLMSGAADRETLRRVQTPQAFRYDAILHAHRAWAGDKDAGDDAQVLAAADGEVALVEGDERLKKITFAEDFMPNTSPMLPIIRTGMGYDVHRLAAGEELWLGGVQIPHSKGLAGHSDADVLLHAIVDAILGALGEGDIGSHFPPSDAQWKGAPSSRFVTHARDLAHKAGFAISHVDSTLICEAPKIGPHREVMRERIAELLNIEMSSVSVKATTTERLGFTGRGEGIAAQAIATLVKQA